MLGIHWTKRIYGFLLAAFLTAFFVFPAYSGGLCKGRFFNPITDVNWLAYSFPITIGGVPFSMGGGYNPPLMQEPAVCVCPSHIPPNPPVPGIGMTYWEPMYLVETTRDVGCIHTMGAVQVPLAPKTMQGSGATPAKQDSTQANSLHIHWMSYPLWSILKVFSSGVCLAPSAAFDLGFMSEVDPTWLNDEWSVILSPEAVLFNNPIGQLACPVDGIAAAIHTPIEAIFWCLGTWGPVYPFSGNTNTAPSYQTSDIVMVMKHIQRWSRVGNMLTKIGPGAICTSTYMPLTPKGQWRIDPVWPIPYMGPTPIYPGKPEQTWGYLPPTQTPGLENGAYQIFIGTQCCLRP